MFICRDNAAHRNIKHDVHSFPTRRSSDLEESVRAKIAETEEHKSEEKSQNIESKNQEDVHKEDSKDQEDTKENTDQETTQDNKEKDISQEVENKEKENMEVTKEDADQNATQENTEKEEVIKKEERKESENKDETISNEKKTKTEILPSNPQYKELAIYHKIDVISTSQVTIKVKLEIKPKEGSIPNFYCPASKLEYEGTDFNKTFITLQKDDPEKDFGEYDINLKVKQMNVNSVPIVPIVDNSESLEPDTDSLTMQCPLCTSFNSISAYYCEICNNSLR